MNKPTEQDQPVKIELGAKAELKASVETTIPEKSTGRFVDAITDMFRPFSEARGLKADQIRLQREEVAIEIARRAKIRLAIEDAPVNPIPLKILVPLIEYSSNEDIDDDYMINSWAELLATAAKMGSIDPRFVHLLPQLTSDMCILLESIALKTENEYSRVWLQEENKLKGKGLDKLINLDAIKYEVEDSYLEYVIRELRENWKNTDFNDWYDRFLLSFCTNGIVIHLITQGTAELPEDPRRLIDWSDLELLESLNLVRFKECNWVFDFPILGHTPSRFSIQYYQITGLGLRFLSAWSRKVRQIVGEADGP